MKDNKKIIGLGILTALASSLCCIVPLIAFISGAAGMASSFSWLTPFRPYLIVFTVLALGFAWYQTLKPKKEVECKCESSPKSSFLQSRLFLGIMTVFALAMTAFPYYSAAFYPQQEKSSIITNADNVQTLYIGVEGMTCTGCEEHIRQAVNALDGVFEVEASYRDGSATVEFDPSKANIEEIKEAIAETGYSVTKVSEVPKKSESDTE